MIRNAARLFYIAALLTTFSSTESSAAGAADVAAIHAADSAWEKAYNGGDVEGVVSLYDANAVLLPPGAPPAKGREAIRAFFAKDMAESGKAGVRFILGAKPDGGVSGSWGWSSGTYVVKDKSGKVVETGKYLSVSKKVGGKWLYVRDTWNADGPASAAEPATPQKK
jgi:ketosteroid isomerase-like protein